jgi:hypothetical protein
MAVLQSNRTGNMLPGLVGQPRDGVRYAELNAKPDTRLSGALGALADGAADLGKAYLSIKADADRVSKQQQAVSLNDAASYYQARIDQEIAGCYNADGTLDVGKAQMLDASVTDGIMQETLNRFPKVTAEGLRDKTIAWQTNRMTKFSTAIKQQSHLNFGASKNAEAEENIRLFIDTGKYEAIVKAYGCLRDAVNDGYATDDAAQPYLTIAANKFVTGNAVDFDGIDKMDIKPGQTFDNGGSTITVVADDANILDGNTQISVSKLRGLIRVKAQQLVERRQKADSELSTRIERIALPTLLDNAQVSGDAKKLQTLLDLSRGRYGDKFNLSPTALKQINATINDRQNYQAAVTAVAQMPKIEAVNGVFSEVDIARMKQDLANAESALGTMLKGSNEHTQQSYVVSLLNKRLVAAEKQNGAVFEELNVQNLERFQVEIQQNGLELARQKYIQEDPSAVNPRYAYVRNHIKAQEAIANKNKELAEEQRIIAERERIAADREAKQEAKAAILTNIADRNAVVKAANNTHADKVSAAVKKRDEALAEIAKQQIELAKTETRINQIQNKPNDVETGFGAMPMGMGMPPPAVTTWAITAKLTEKERQELNSLSARKLELEQSIDQQEAIDRECGDAIRKADFEWQKKLGYATGNMWSDDKLKEVPPEQVMRLKMARNTLIREVKGSILSSLVSNTPLFVDYGGETIPFTFKSEDDISDYVTGVCGFSPKETEDIIKDIRSLRVSTVITQEAFADVICAAQGFPRNEFNSSIIGVRDPDLLYNLIKKVDPLRQGMNDKQFKQQVIQEVCQHLSLVKDADDDEASYVDATKDDTTNNDYISQFFEDNESFIKYRIFYKIRR